MKNAISWKVIAGLALVILWAWPAVAQTQMLRVNVPFPFVAAHQSLPAGQYVLTIQSEHSLGQLSATNTNDACIVPLAASAYRDGSMKEGMLRFAKYGSQYVLTGIWQPGEAAGKAVAGSQPPKEYGKGGAPIDVVALR